RAHAVALGISSFRALWSLAMLRRAVTGSASPPATSCSRSIEVLESSGGLGRSIRRSLFISTSVNEFEARSEPLRVNENPHICAGFPIVRTGLTNNWTLWFKSRRAGGGHKRCFDLEGCHLHHILVDGG